MASKVGKDDEEKDSLICGICLEYYDDNVHIPKFLQCFHTCCALCLKAQARNLIVSCPFCRKDTRLNGGVESMTTNFYIFPQVQKLAEKRKEIDSLLASTKDNWAKAIGMRREGLCRLKQVHDSLRLLETMVVQQSEDNNEKIVILQSLLEEPGSPKDFDELFSSKSELENDLEQSESDLEVAKAFSSSIIEVEKYVCHLTLKSNSKQYCIKTLEKQLTFDNSSQHGPYIGAAQSVLSYILLNMKQNQLWDSDELNGSTSSLYSSSASSESQQQLCYIQFGIDDDVKPPVVIKLDFDEAPIMSRNFLNYCQGSNGLKYEGSPLFMIKAGEFIMGGRFNDLTRNCDDIPPDSGRYLADQSTLDETKGAIRMRHRGRCEDGVYVSSEFAIILHDHVHRNPMTTVFGYVIEGVEVCQEISRLHTHSIVIISSGVWPPED